MSFQWLEWVQKIQAIAQTGLYYSENPYDIERYQQLRQIAIEMVASFTDLQPSRIENWFESEKGYATPKVDVRGAVFCGDRILLVKEREDGCWTLPGGWADVGESPSKATIREIYEESGYQTRVIKLVAVYDRNHPRHAHPPHLDHVYKLLFQCELLGGTPTSNWETEDAQFFKEKEIPKLSLTRVVPSQIDRLFEHYRNPNLPTDFD
jgi:ADP-ribose pyrophosphatase YjhB (NUDIX family)